MPWVKRDGHQWKRAMETESFRDANIVVTVGTGGCRYDNLRHRQ